MSEVRMPEKELPSNSFASKKAPKEEKQKPKAVIQTPRKRHEPSMIEQGATEVKNFVVTDIVIPTAKDMLFNIVSGLFDMAGSAIEAAIFGEASPRWNSTPRRGRRRSSHVPYNSIYDRGSSMRRRRVDYDEEADFDEIYDYSNFPLSRDEFEDVKDELFDVVDRQGYATIGDLNSILNLRGQFTDEDWGWTEGDIASIRARAKGRGTYYIQLPKPRPL